MFAWPGNKHAPGNFHRVRSPATSSTSGLRTPPNGIEIDFPIAVDPTKAKLAVKRWHIARTKNYGSKHQNEKALNIDKVEALNNNKTLRLTLLDLTLGECETNGGERFYAVLVDL